MFQVNEQLNISTSRSYTPDITPVILAAHRDNYEIVKILLERGKKREEKKCTFLINFEV